MSLLIRLSGDDNKENVEEEPVEITFAEYKKQQEERSKPEFNLRKANEGEKLKNLKELKTKQTEEDKEEDGSIYFPKTVSDIFSKSPLLSGT